MGSLPQPGALPAGAEAGDSHSLSRCISEQHPPPLRVWSGAQPDSWEAQSMLGPYMQMSMLSPSGAPYPVQPSLQQGLSPGHLFPSSALRPWHHPLPGDEGPTAQSPDRSGLPSPGLF